MHRCCRSGERRGRADTWPGAQENLRDTDADAAPKKDNCQRDEKEIANAIADSENDAIAHRRGKEETKRITNSVAAAKEEAFAICKSDRNANAVADFFSEKETNPGSGRGDSHADSEEEKDLADAFTHCFSSSQEGGIADSGAI